MRQVLPFILVTLISCSTSSRQADNTTTDDPKTDFETFLGLFERQMTFIPKNFTKQFIKVDSNQVDGVWAYEKINFSVDVIGLVYKASCTAGGVCERFVLVIFDSQGNKLGETEVGHHYADYGGDSNLTYSVDKDKIELKLIETEVLEADDGTDKEQVTVDTTYYKRIDVTTGRINGE